MQATRVRSFLFVMCVFLVQGGLAQEDSTATPTGGEEDWSWFRFRRSPTIGIWYGGTATTLHGSQQSIAGFSAAEVRLGGTREDVEDQTAGVVDHRTTYLSFGAVSSGLGGTRATDAIALEQWRVGTCRERGYGYRFGPGRSDAALLFLSTEGMQWTQVKIREGMRGGADSVRLARFDGRFRFGTKMDAVIRFRIAPLFAIDAGFERSAVFERHMFWRWAGSALLEGGGQWLLDRFVDRILKSTPEAAPVVAFLLKNAFAYGVYELRKESMNFPFDSEAPLMNDSFRVGLTFVF